MRTVMASMAPHIERAAKLWLWCRERFPLPLTGLLVLGFLLLALRTWGYGRMDLVVFALTICALAIVLGSLLLVLIAGFSIRRRLHADKQANATSQSVQAEADFPNDTGFRVATIRWLPLVSLQWEVVHPDAIRTRNRLSGDGLWLEEEITPRQRCLVQHIERRFTVSDVLGLARFSWRQQRPDSLLALPGKGMIRHLPVLRSLSAEDGLPDPAGRPEGDRMEIRAYSPGDPVRNIMWGIYARNRELNVRLEEKSVFHSRRVLAYLISGPGDESAAAVARVALESGALGDDWQFGADGTSGGTSQRAEALQRIAASRAIGRKAHPWGLDEFLEQSGDDSAHCIVFAAAGGNWTQALQQSAARFRGSLSVILATDGFEREEPLPLWRKLLFRRSSGDAISAASRHDVRQLTGLLNELRHYSGSAMVVDRHTGLSFDQTLKRV